MEPIVWWIENTTPRELRQTIREGAEAWNIAFEQAGFRNAVVVKEQPDTASWDAGDIRYNVLRWTSSPDPPFGGYGPSFVDPRTGQIPGADVMLEYIFITNRLREMELFQTAALGYLAMDEAELERSRDEHACSPTTCNSRCSMGARCCRPSPGRGPGGTVHAGSPARPGPA